MPHSSNHLFVFKRPAGPATNDYPGLFRNRALYHILFWLSYYVFAILISLSIHRIYDWHFYIELISLTPPDILLVYLNLYVLIPNFLFRKRPFSYFLLLLISIFLQSALTIWMHRLYALSGTRAFVPVMDLNIRNFAIQGLNAIYLLGLTTGLKFVKDWMLQERQWQEREKQHAETELNFLKSQIQPHFLFNTLNNLYSLTVQRSDLAPEVVLKLSDLMSYMLYESGAPTVSLDKEIANLENYIALEKLRFGDRLVLLFKKEGHTASAQIPPLILLAYVENSFKHGLKNNIDSIRVDIALSVQAGQLFFSISNPAIQRVGEEDGNGIGLKNTTRRLELLYGSQYKLDLTQTQGLFSVHLKIPLS